MEPTRLPDGRLLVPARAETEDGTIIGDGVRVIGPDDPAYEVWERYLAAVGE